MDDNSVVDAFRALSTNESRRAGLDALTHELSRYEWRLLRDILDNRSFDFDIVGNLPVEIVALIFAYLDTATPYRFQHVSRNWQLILLSLPVLKASLSAFHQSPPHVYAPNADRVFCMREARRIHAFRTLQPSAAVRLQFSDDIDKIEDIRLCGHHIVWDHYRDRSDRVIHALDLRTWTCHALHTAGREVAKQVLISDTILLVTTWSTICYVWPLQALSDDERKSFRIPNMEYERTMSCRESIIACCTLSQDLLSLSVYIWDFETLRGRSFEVREDPSHFFFSPFGGFRFYHLLNVLPQPETRSIIIFGDIHCKHDGCDKGACERKAPGSIFYAKFTFEGKCLMSSFLPRREDMSIYLPEPGTIIPSGEDGKFLLELGDIDPANRAEDTGFPALFDERAFKFSPIKLPGNHQRWDSIPEYGMNSNIMVWKDTFCSFSTINEDVYRMPETIDDAKDPRTLFKDQEAPISTVYHYARLRMNDRYLVRTWNNLLYVVSFEEDNQVPKTSGPFPEANAHVEVLIPQNVQG